MSGVKEEATATAEGAEFAPLEGAEREEGEKMKSVMLMGFGGSRMMKMLPQPIVAPTDGQVLIKVSSCGMSFQDLLLRQGITDLPPRTPLMMGSECGGVVEALGPNTTGFSVGDRVIALTEFKAWAELVAVPANQVYKLPDNVPFQEGVCLLVHYVTAYILLFDMANLRQGQSLLLHSAAGGVGQAILQLAATVGNVTIYGTASEHKHGDLHNKVTHLFPHSKDYVQEIKRLAPGGLDLVLDCMCGEDTNRGISLLKPLGKYILYGSANIVTGDTKSFLSFAKSVDKVNPVKLCDDNRSIGGFDLRHLLFRQGQYDYVSSIIKELLQLHAQKKVNPVIDSVWAFEDVGEAMLRLQDRKNVGKVLLDPTKEPLPKKRAQSEAAEVVTESGEHKNNKSGEDHEHKNNKSGEDHEHKNNKSGEDHEHKNKSGGDHEHKNKSGGDHEHKNKSGGDHEHKNNKSGEDHEHKNKSGGDHEHKNKSGGDHEHTNNKSGGDHEHEHKDNKSGGDHEHKDNKSGGDHEHKDNKSGGDHEHKDNKSGGDHEHKNKSGGDHEHEHKDNKSGGDHEHKDNKSGASGGSH